VLRPRFFFGNETPLLTKYASHAGLATRRRPLLRTVVRSWRELLLTHVVPAGFRRTRF
jgi:hypothetical protein